MSAIFGVNTSMVISGSVPLPRLDASKSPITFVIAPRQS
jgi:hypothetical protein